MLAARARICTAGDDSGGGSEDVITLERAAERPEGAPVDVVTQPAPSRTDGLAAGRAGLAVLSTGVLALLVAVDGPTPLRLALALVAVLLTPGLSIVGVLGLPRSAARAAMVVAVSISVTSIAAEALLLTGHLTAGTGVLALLAISAPFALAQVVLARRAGASLLPDVPAITRPDWLASQRTSLVLTGAAGLCWIASAALLEPRHAGELGLLSALPPVWWLGVAALTIAFLLHVRRGLQPLLATVQVAALTGFLYVVVTVAEPYSRIPTSWTHVGLIDYLVRDHRIVDHFDARYSWPGSLSLGALLTQLSGVTSSMTFTKWALPVFVALWALAVYALARAYASNARVAWIAVWIFLSCNWVGQDYLSSQAINFFLVVTVVAAVATWFPRRPLRAHTRFLPYEQPAQAFRTSPQGLGLLLLIVAIAFAIASSHQLSPFTLVGMLAALWAVDRRDIRLLPVLIAVITLSWICWGADAYWIGHFQRLTQDVGQVSGVVSKGTVGRIGDGVIGRRIVLGVRVLLSLGALAGAGIALLHALRRGRTWLFPVGVLAAVPIGAVALQSYGGELGLRIFLFALPFASLLLADAVSAALDRPWRRPQVPVLALVLGALATTGAFVVARYGNEQFEQTYREDIAVVRAFQREAPGGAWVFGTNTSNPFRMLPYHDYRPRKNDAFVHTDDIPTMQALRSTGAPRGYLIVFESSIRESYLRQGAPHDWDRVLRARLDKIGARELFRDGRAALYRYSIDEVDPLPPAPVVHRPHVSARMYELLDKPALAGAVLVSLLLLLLCSLQVTAVRWRPGWLETVALIAAVAAVAIVFARFEILT